jgi:leader peptidase (prepilin peptidase)/N-methyltransferase
MMVALVAALVPSLVLFALHGRAARKMAIPFAPFLALGALVALFAGDSIMEWYVGLSG